MYNAIKHFALGFFVAVTICALWFSHFLLTNDGMGYTAAQRSQMAALAETLER